MTAAQTATADITRSEFIAYQPAFYGCLMLMFNRPWFGRHGFLQEVAAARTAEVILGTLSIPWTALQVAISRFEQMDLPPSTRMIQRNCSGRFKEILLCQERMSSRDKERPSLTAGLFYILFYVSCTRKTSDARDRLYGILGMCEGEGLDSKVRDPAIMPNYPKIKNNKNCRRSL
jgi:hypothetical protein